MLLRLAFAVFVFVLPPVLTMLFAPKLVEVVLPVLADTAGFVLELGSDCCYARWAAASLRWAYAYAGADTAAAAGWWWWWGEEKRSIGGRWYCLFGRQYPILLLLPRRGTPARTSPARSAAAPAAGP
ncbi:hypothetical protein B0H13DRAFT_1855858 [Mycena leptocephala]|nr:hypothetical protein B0H13DRAFT_1855858 [Mycena leptocephala]